MATSSVFGPSPPLDPEILNQYQDKSSKPKVLTKTKADRDFGLIPVPRRLRYNPDMPFDHGLVMNLSFGFGSTFFAANLYYCQPLLIQFAETFNVSHNQVSSIPTLTQAGYAAGLLFIAPLGDLVRRRQLILGLILLATTLSIGLAITNNLIVFELLSFLVRVVSVVPQILLPLAADLAPPNRRASAISIVLAGILLGILVGRVLAGIIAEFTTWRVVYYVVIGTQTFMLFGGYSVLPDYPPKNDHLTYWEILCTMAKDIVTEPLLIQVCLINFLNSACSSNLWVMLTFLLGGPPYNYSTLVIGLFGLVRMVGVAIVPILGRWADDLFPWHGTLACLLLLLCFQAIQLGAGGINIAAVVITILGTDLFRQTAQVCMSMSVFSISEKARSRLNSLSILSFFIGQVMGTSVGTKVFIQNGWRAGAGLSMGWYRLQLLLLLVRGPHCHRYTWFGYEGGLEGRRSVIEQAARRKEAELSPGDLTVAKRSSLLNEGEKMIIGKNPTK